VTKSAVKKLMPRLVEMIIQSTKTKKSFHLWSTCLYAKLWIIIEDIIEQEKVLHLRHLPLSNNEMMVVTHAVRMVHNSSAVSMSSTCKSGVGTAHMMVDMLPDVTPVLVKSSLQRLYDGAMEETRLK